MKHLLKNSELSTKGLLKIPVTLSSEIIEARRLENWILLDELFRNEFLPSGSLSYIFSELIHYNSIEHMIAIRQSPDDEEGIWHDDGSRILGFSLSLNFNISTIVGGNLLFRRIGEEQILHEITPLPMGTLVVFLTGIYGYEHRVSAVREGKRVVIAGWCS